MKTEAQFKAGLRSWVRTTEPWREPVDGAELLDRLAGALRRHVALPEWGPEALALWVTHTYGFELRDVTAYVAIESPEKRCGKTTLLSALKELVCRPVAAANISSPALFRVIEEARPTLLIDEADTFLQGNDELRGILNSGYSRETAFVVRVSRRAEREEAPGAGGEGEAEEGETRAGEGGRLARYSCWCPKALASIGRLPEALADRCIVVRLHRKPERERVERVRAGREEWMELRRQCARFVADHREEIAQAQPALPEALHDRAADIWEPLLAMADLAGSGWPERARAAAIGLTREAEDSNPLGTLLLDILIAFVQAKEKRLFSRELIALLNKADDRPWMTLRKKGEVDELWLARQLAPYGVRPRTMRIGHAVAKGYANEDFGPLYGRYIPKSEIEALREPDAATG